jgi:peptide/nickel transport system permease protein
MNTKLLLIFTLVLLLLSFAVGQDTVRVNLDHAFGGMSYAHPLGTDNLGRDTASLLLGGASRTLGAVGVATAISFACGIPLGMLAGYHGGLAEGIIVTFADFTLVLPSFICALVFSSLFGMNPYAVGVVFGFGGMGEYINQASSLTKRIKGLDFIEAETVLGIPDLKILLHHVLPNIVRPLFVFMGNRAANVSLQYAALTYIGLGCDINNPDWGTMLYQYRVYALDKPLLVLSPMVAVCLLALLLQTTFDDSRRPPREISIYDCPDPSGKRFAPLDEDGTRMGSDSARNIA